MGTGSTGPLYWNEETQRWEEGGGSGAGGGSGSAAGSGSVSGAAAGGDEASSGAGAGAAEGGDGASSGAGARAESDRGGSGEGVSWPSAVGEPDDSGAVDGAEGGASGAGGQAASPSGGEGAPDGAAPPLHPDLVHSSPTLTGIQGPGSAPGAGSWPGAGAPPHGPGHSPHGPGRSPHEAGQQSPGPGYPSSEPDYPSPAYGYPPTSAGYPPPGAGYPPSGAGYPPSGVPEPGSGRSRRVWAVVGGAAVVGVAVGLIVTFVVRDGGGSEGRAGGGSASVSASATPSDSGTVSEPGAPETPSGSPSALTSDLPAGFEAYDDPEGFTIARPTGWTRTTVASQFGMDVVHYRSPDGERRLQVFEVSESSPAASHELFLSDAVPKAPGFTELSLDNLGDGDFAGSRLEYLADSIKGEPDVGTWHVVDERFEAADGKIYAVAAYGADADGRDDERELLRTALSAFCPPYTTCGG